jgi:hypothetical protein
MTKNLLSTSRNTKKINNIIDIENESIDKK